LKEATTTELEMISAIVADVRAEHSGPFDFTAEGVLELMVRAARAERAVCAALVEQAPHRAFESIRWRGPR
jgi:hypothetical protein